MGSKLLFKDGMMQGDLDANHFRILNLDTSNLPPAGIPPTVNPPASNWLNGWDATLMQWSYAQPRFSDLPDFLSTPQMNHITAVGVLRVGQWQAQPIEARYLPSLDQISSPIGDVSLNNRKLTNVADPVLAQDAVNKRFMDALLQGLNPKAAVRLATTGEIPALAGLSIPIDGSMPNSGDRILVKDQSVGAGRDYQNGIYIAGPGAWVRATDSDTFDELNRAYCVVTSGTQNGGSSWVQVNTLSGIGVGHPVQFVIFSIGQDINPGNGLSFTGNVLNVGPTAGRISVTADAVDIDSTYAGQHSIHVLGTIDDGIWHGTPIAAMFGGTGIANAYNLNLGAGAVTFALGGLASPGQPCTFNVFAPTVLDLPVAGKLATIQGVETFTNKRVTPRFFKIATSPSPSFNTDTIDVGYITNLSTNITSMSSNLTGTPTDSQELAIWIKDNGIARTINWDTKFIAPTEVALPVTTVPNLWLLCKFMFSTEKNQWVLTNALTHI